MYRYSQPRTSPYSLTPTVKLLIIINAIAYLIELLWFWLTDNNPCLILHLGLVPRNLLKGEIWQVITYAFLHDPSGPSHIIFNMFALWIFGPLFERLWGKRYFIKFYLISTMIAASFVIVTSFFSTRTFNTPTIGASGAIFALLSAYGIIFPENYLFFYFILPIKGRHFLYLIIVITAMYALSATPVSASAHFGGLFAGYILVTGRWRHPISSIKELWFSILYRIQHIKKKRRFRVIDDDHDQYIN